MLPSPRGRLFLAGCLVWVCSVSALAQAQELNWAQQMFDRQKHDFGTVARGADVSYRLMVTNPHPYPVRMAGVRTGCGCIGATLPPQTTLQPGESGAILVTVDTRRFTRDRNSHVFVTFDLPQYIEVSIGIHAYIRTDVVLTPGGAEFGAVLQGTEQTKQIEIAYAGRDDWKIKEVVCKNDQLIAEVKEISRGPGRATYNLTVTLKSSMPLGELREQVTIVTDDTNSPHVPILVEGKIEPEITITPVVSFGMLVPGQTKSVNVVLKGRKPFQVEKLESESGSAAFQVKLPEKASLIHVIPLIVTASETPGALNEEFTVTIAGNPTPLHFKAFGKVLDANGQ